jgi:hypothetical protein
MAVQRTEIEKTLFYNSSIGNKPHRKIVGFRNSRNVRLRSVYFVSRRNNFIAHSAFECCALQDIL